MSACRLTLAVVQSDVERFAPGRNVARAARAVRAAARRGAKLVVFPEMFLTGYEVMPQLSVVAMRQTSAPIRAVRQIARDHATAILVGYPELRADGVYNSSMFIMPTGDVAGIYRKVHLFDAERGHFRPGHRYCVLHFGTVRVGLLICYDLEFPEAARTLSLRGADILAVCTANMAPYRHAQDVFVRARALENHAFVALANRVGREDRTVFIGGSGVWDPFGEPLVQADEDEGVFVATIDARQRRLARRRFDYLAERRPETYAGSRA